MRGLFKSADDKKHTEPTTLLLNKKEDFADINEIKLVNLSDKGKKEPYLGCKEMTQCHGMLILAVDSEGNSKYAVLGHFLPLYETDGAKKRLGDFLKKHSAELDGLQLKAMAVGGSDWSLYNLRLNDVANEFDIDFKAFKTLATQSTGFDFVWMPLRDELTFKTNKGKVETLTLGFLEGPGLKIVM